MKHFLIITVMVLAFHSILIGQTKDEHYQKATDLYDKDSLAQSLYEISFALKLDSTNADYLLLKGNALAKLKQHQAAYGIYSYMLQLDPEDVFALNQRGVLLNNLQQSELAIQDFTKALRVAKNDTVKLTSYVNRGAAKIAMRDFQGAYDDFMAAYKIDSLSIGTLNNLATVCDEVGKGDQTLGYLYRIIKIDSTFIGAYGNIGFKYQEMGDYKTAIQFFDKVLSLEPKEPLALSNRAFNKYKLGNLEGALSDINQSIAGYPANSYAFRTKALIHIALQQTKAACTDIQEALRLGFTKMYGDEADRLQAKYCLNNKL